MPGNSHSGSVVTAGLVGLLPTWIHSANHCSVPTTDKLRTLFRVLDTEGVGHLTPGSLAMAMRDVYDAAGLLGSGRGADPHGDAMRLWNTIERGADCR